MTDNVIKNMQTMEKATGSPFGLNDKLAEILNAVEPFLALLDPMPMGHDGTEIAALSGDLCEKYVDDALSLTIGDFRELLRVRAALVRPTSGGGK